MTGPLTVYRGTETLRRGWTTGSCAAAASQAAAILLLTGSAPAEIRLLTPGGVTFNLPVEQASLHDGEAVCAVRKDAGDDPDITHFVGCPARGQRHRHRRRQRRRPCDPSGTRGAGR